MLIYHFFKDLINIKINFDIGKKTWFGTGGKAKVLLVINNLKSLNFFNASKNIPMLDFLSVNGINVYDVLRRDTLVLTKDAVNSLEDRLS